MNFRFLDLGLPLWVGGVPARTAQFLPIQSQGISACVRNMYIDGVLLDLASHVAEQRSQAGCSEVHGNNCNTKYYTILSTQCRLIPVQIIIVELVLVRTGTSITCVFAQQALQESCAIKVCTLLSISLWFIGLFSC